MPTGEEAQRRARLQQQTHHGETAPGTSPGSWVRPRSQGRSSRSDSSARPALTPQPRGPAGAQRRATHNPALPMAVPASRDPLLVPFQFPPGPATRHPHSGSLPEASLRSSVITWSYTAPPLHRKRVTSPSRPGSARKAVRERHKNLRAKFTLKRYPINLLQMPYRNTKFRAAGLALIFFYQDGDKREVNSNYKVQHPPPMRAEMT